MKRCIKCNQDKHVIEFSKRGTQLQSYCKECNKLYHRDHYKQNKQDYLKKNYSYKKKYVAWIRSLKNSSCVDCGIKYNPWIMHFDHRENKLFGIAEAANNTISKKKVLEEIKKCDLVCANCHAERTYKRRNNAL